MKKPTKKIIKQEINRIEAIKNLIPPFSTFGDDNKLAAKTQISVLRKFLDGRDPEIIESQLLEDRDDELISNYVFSNGRDAIDWLNGDSDEDSLAAGWEELVNLRESV